MSESMQNKGISQSFAKGWSSVVWGLGVALCFSISPIFIRHGLELLPSPLLGVTIGMGFSALGYGILLLLRRNHGVRSAEQLPARPNPPEQPRLRPGSAR